MTEPDPKPTSRAIKGTISKRKITAVLLRNVGWTSITPGTFDTCEINFYDDASEKAVGGVLGFRFTTTGINGRPALVYVSMESVSAVQAEEPEEVKNVNQYK